MRPRKHALPLGILLLFFIALVYISWIRFLPYGSDTDEHLLVAKTMIESGKFAVGDMHGTKFPPMVSLLLILFELLGLNAASVMIMANTFFVLLSTIIFYYLTSQFFNRWAALLGAIFLLSNITIWRSAFLIIGDVLFLLLVVLVILSALEINNRKWTIIILSVFVAVTSVMTRSVGIALAVVLFVSLLFADPNDKKITSFLRSLPILIIPMILLGLYSFWQSQYGVHPTGYAYVFSLVDPYDASKGTLDVYQFFARTKEGLMLTIESVSNALTLPSMEGVLGICIATLLIFAALFSAKKHLLVVGTFTLIYFLILVFWPYKGVRFAIPLIPIGAFGVTAIVDYLMDKRLSWAVGLAVILLFVHLTNSVVALNRQKEYLNTRWEAMHRSFNDLLSWSRENFDDDPVIASFDYRALALRLDRSIVPMYYSSDLDFHIQHLQNENVSYFILSDDIYDLRGAYARQIIGKLANQANLIYQNNAFEVYRLNFTIGN